ncbi:hypothetical protein AJ80_04702 [Polytolypa hystricis UAMH7299]|uniref:Beta-lactamase-related domain-containing protein n=1 Tax=Polytolypa hystricis (strain UAMH7299) TaxID=1447883 RepID=A0A2B7Y0V2_POLH7|nr:hypothetical protein AJ80_04702 [Polytolypa hystricis UAMH7299]
MADTISALQDVDSVVEEICHNEGIPGVSIGIINGGETIYTRNFGFRNVEAATPPDVNTLYGIASLTKAMVAAGGELSWTTLVKDILPEFDHDNVEITASLTLSDLLAHRSGLAGFGALSLAFQGDGEMLLPREALFEVFNHLPQPFPLRQESLYLVWGYAVVGRVIETVSQKSLHEFLTEEVFKPLGMNNTTLRPSFNKRGNVAEPYAALANGEPYHLKKKQVFADTFFEASGASSPDRGPTSNTSVVKQIPYILSNHIAIENPSLGERSYGFGWVRTQLPGTVGLIGDNLQLWPLSELPVFGKGTPPQLTIYYQGATVGYYSSLSLFPDTGSAVVVLTNAIAMSDAADWTWRAYVEALLDFKNPTDHLQLSKDGKLRRIEQFDKMKSTFNEERINGTQPLLPLDAYAGKYTNHAKNFVVDIISATQSGGEHLLNLRFQGLETQTYPLRHYHHNVFEWSLTHDESKMRGRYNIAEVSYYKFDFQIGGPDNDKALSFFWDIDPFRPSGEIFERVSSES